MTWARDIFPNSCRFLWELERHQTCRPIWDSIWFHTIRYFIEFKQTQTLQRVGHTPFSKNLPVVGWLYCVPNRWRNVSNVHQKMIKTSIYIYIYELSVIHNYIYFWTTSKWRLSPLSSIIHDENTINSLSRPVTVGMPLKAEAFNVPAPPWIFITGSGK